MTTATASRNRKQPAKLSPFARGYIDALLWAETGDDGAPLDKKYNRGSFAAEAMACILADCETFARDNAETLQGFDDETAGHDFWLTRQHHGAGYWDGDYSEPAGELLTIAAQKFGELSPYVFRGRIYF